MIISVIKSIVKNLTDKKLSITISSHLRLELAPHGTAGDVASISGDVFTRMERTQVVEAFATLLLDRKAELTYSIDKVAQYCENEGTPNINSGAIIQDKVAEINKGKRLSAPLIEIESEPEEVAKSVDVNEEPKVEEPAKVEEPEIVTPEAAALEDAPKKAQAVAAVKVEEPTKPARKPRQIKAN